jgi:hypothetical protein
MEGLWTRRNLLYLEGKGYVSVNHLNIQCLSRFAP